MVGSVKYGVIPMTDVIRCEIRNTQILRPNEKEQTCDNTVTANIIFKATFLRAFNGFHVSLLRSHVPFNCHLKQKAAVVLYLHILKHYEFDRSHPVVH